MDGQPPGNEFLGARGAAIPAVLAAQPVYYKYWASRGVDVSPFFKVLNGPRIPAPGGAGFTAGFDALKPYFDEMFLGRSDVPSSLADAQPRRTLLRSVDGVTSSLRPSLCVPRVHVISPWRDSDRRIPGKQRHLLVRKTAQRACARA